MPVIIQYLLKLSVSAAVIYLFYYLVLRRLTFYSLNRWYLSGYTLLCFAIPFINITQIANKADEKLPALNYIPVMQNINNYVPRAMNMAENHNYNLWDAMILLLLMGSSLLLGKLAVQVYSFIRLKRKAKLISDKDSAIYHIDEEIMPFSFGKSIYLNKNMHSDKELGEIIMHEYVHVKQLHSADILIAELFCVLNWYNPFAWFIRHSIRQNLEFIADDNVVRSGIDKKAYQYHLLKVVGVPQYRLANQFNFSSLKKRIIMMNRRRSAKIHLLKFLFILPLLATTLMAFRSEIVNTVNKITTGHGLTLKAVKNAQVPLNMPVTTLTGKVKKEDMIRTNKKGIIKPDTATRKNTDVKAYFDGDVLKTEEISDSYLIIIRSGDRFDSYSNLISVKVKKGDKIKKGELLGTVDVDTITGIPKLKYSRYSGAAIVYDSDGGDTSKKLYNVTYDSYGDNAYVARSSKNGSYSVGSSGNDKVYVVRDKGGKKQYTSQVFVTYSDNGRGDTIRLMADKAIKGKKRTDQHRVFIAYSDNDKRDSIRFFADKAMVITPDREYRYPDDEVRFTIDPKHIDEQEIARMEKEFSDKGFKLKVNNHMNSSDARLNIQVSGERKNNSSSASASFSGSDLHKNNSLIRVTGNTKTGEVSIETLPSGR